MRSRFLSLALAVGLVGLSSLAGTRVSRAASLPPVFVGPALPQAAEAPVTAQKGTFDPGVFQQTDGAIPIINNDDRVDAYFATKGLLAAHEAGLDIREAGTKWVNWLLPRQKADGRFMRYTRQPGANGSMVWKTTDIADADDALLALWVELLYTLSPNDGMPASWQKSVELASNHLDSLRDKRGIYFIARTNPVGLFMDNAEIYQSMVSIAREQGRLGYDEASTTTAGMAAMLGASIQKVFWDKKHSEYRVSTQDIPDSKFYPRATAQVFPMLSGLSTPIASNAEVLDQWLSHHGNDWLTMRYDDYPWGLVAFAAWKVGDNNTALAWQNKNKALRYGDRWTILDEAIYQGLQANLPANVRVASYDPRLENKPEDA